ncbi:CocE/NonD family hydrolase [Streptomyces thermocarboxydus]
MRRRRGHVGRVLRLRHPVRRTARRSPGAAGAGPRHDARAVRARRLPLPRGVPELGSTLAWTHYAIAPDAIARVPSARERDAEHQRHEATEQAIATGEAYRAGALHEQRDAEGIVRWGLDRLREPLDSPRHRAGKIVDRLDAVDVPVLLTGGWFDVFLGPTLELYRRLRRRAENTGGPAPRLVVGPWTHDDYSGRAAGLDFGPEASAEAVDLTALHLRWFDAVLRGRALGSPLVQVFLMGADRWVEADVFPPRDARPLELYLTPEGALAPEPAGSGAGGSSATRRPPCRRAAGRSCCSRRSGRAPPTRGRSRHGRTSSPGAPGRWRRSSR